MMTPAQANLLASTNGLGIAVVYRPDERKFSGSVGFSAPVKASSQRKSTALAIETAQLLLTPGTQFVEAEKWALIYGHASNKETIDRMIRRRTLAVYEPEHGENGPTGTTIDFPDEDDAINLVENSYGMDWLRASFAQETQRMRVKDACRERMEVLNRMANDRKIATSALN